MQMLVLQHCYPCYKTTPNSTVNIITLCISLLILLPIVTAAQGLKA